MRHAKSPSDAYPEMGQAELDTVFTLISRVLGRLGYKVRRSDSRGDILADIVYELDSADLVCADLTGLNPNVMYELGIRHGFTKCTVLITQDLDELPFDLRAYHCIEYRWITGADQRRFGKQLRETIRAIDANPDTRFGPVDSHLGTKRLAFTERDKAEVVAQLRGVLAELNYLRDMTLEAIAESARKYPLLFELRSEGWSVNVQLLEDAYNSTHWSDTRRAFAPTFPSIDRLLARQYIPRSFDSNHDVRAFLSALGTLRMNMHGADDRLKSCLRFFALVDACAHDTVDLIRAIESGRKGVDLKLCCRTSHGFGDGRLKPLDLVSFAVSTTTSRIEDDITWQ